MTTCGTCGGGGIVCATEAGARGAPIGSPLSGPCNVCKGSGVWPYRRTLDPWINYVLLSKTEWQQAIDASTLKASIPFKSFNHQ
jgi:hypothetical protein